MRKLLSLAILLLCPALAGAGEAFLTAIEDVPLAPGLAEQAGGGMVFDSPTGRIVEAVANGPVSAEQITSFYTETLPQLGWSDTGQLTFKRDSEILRITIDNAPRKGGTSEKNARVRFNLAPNS